MDTLILIFSGCLIAGLISKKQFSLFLDIIFGILGAWATYLLISSMNFSGLSTNHILVYLAAITGSVVIIHIGRIFENSQRKGLLFT